MIRGIEVVTVARLSQMRVGHRPICDTQTGGLLVELELVVEFLLHFVHSGRRQALPVRANLAISKLRLQALRPEGPPMPSVQMEQLHETVRIWRPAYGLALQFAVPR